jgi:hypothetical protein
VKDILLSRVMMGVGIIFLVLHLPRTLLALYEVTRIPRILTCMVHGCRQGSLNPSFFLNLYSAPYKGPEEAHSFMLSPPPSTVS